MGIFGRGQKSTKTVLKSVRLERATEPVTPITKISASASSLVKPAEAATSSLQKRNLLGIRADAILVLDHSGSMSRDYSSGNVQKLVERALAYGLQFDDEIEAFAFDDRVWPDHKVNLSNYEGIVDRELFKPRDMGMTNMVAAFEEVEKRAKKASKPIIVLFVTDGDPNFGTKSKVESQICELAAYPVFVKFLALRDVPFLQTLDDLGPDKRLLDNVDAKFFRSMDSVSDEEFAEAMADEFDSWLDEAILAGVITT